MFEQPLQASAPDADRVQRYEDVITHIKALCGEDNGSDTQGLDWVAAMATVACELHHAFDHFHWTGTAAPFALRISHRPHVAPTPKVFTAPLHQISWL